MLSKSNDGRNQGEIIYSDDFVPKEHLLRKIDAAVDFTKIYEIVDDLYCKNNGRPSADPRAVQDSDQTAFVQDLIAAQNG